MVWTPYHNLVHCWPLDGNANDIIGGCNGTPSNITWEAGKFGQQCAYFNGTDSIISFTQLPADIFNLTEFSFSYWLKYAGFYSRTIFVYRLNSTNFIISRLASSTTLIGVVRSGQPTTLNNSMTPGGTNTWRHYVWTFKATEVDPVRKNYRNAINLFNGWDAAVPTPPSEGDFAIGAELDGSEVISGHLQQLCFWDRALTQDDINVLYNSDNGIHYPFGNISRCTVFVTSDLTARVHPYEVDVGHFKETIVFNGVGGTEATPFGNFLALQNEWVCELSPTLNVVRKIMYTSTSPSSWIIKYDDNLNMYCQPSVNNYDVRKYNSNGELLWTYTQGFIIYDIAVDPAGIYAYYLRDASIWRINATTGALASGDGFPITTVTGARILKVGRDGYLYVGNRSTASASYRGLYKYDPDDGAFLWFYETYYNVSNTALVNDFDVRADGACAIAAVQSQSGWGVHIITSAGALVTRWAMHWNCQGIRYENDDYIYLYCRVHGGTDISQDYWYHWQRVHRTKSPIDWHVDIPVSKAQYAHNWYFGGPLRQDTIFFRGDLFDINGNTIFRTTAALNNQHALINIRILDATSKLTWPITIIKHGGDLGKVTTSGCADIDEGITSYGKAVSGGDADFIINATAPFEIGIVKVNGVDQTIDSPEETTVHLSDVSRPHTIDIYFKGDFAENVGHFSMSDSFSDITADRWHEDDKEISVGHFKDTSELKFYGYQLTSETVYQHTSTHAVTSAYNFYWPDGVDEVVFKLYGAGASAGGSPNTNFSGGGGGGAGGFAKKTLSGYTAGHHFIVRIRGYGAAISGAVDGNSVVDGTRLEDADADPVVILARAPGGEKGFAAANGRAGGRGGGNWDDSLIGDVTKAGGAGADGIVGYGGGGGGGPSEDNAGNNASTSTGGAASDGLGGKGGDGSDERNGPGNDGDEYCAGGGAATRGNTGGAGARGRAEISYVITYIAPIIRKPGHFNTTETIKAEYSFEEVLNIEINVGPFSLSENLKIEKHLLAADIGFLATSENLKTEKYILAINTSHLSLSEILKTEKYFLTINANHFSVSESLKLDSILKFFSFSAEHFSITDTLKGKSSFIITAPDYFSVSDQLNGSFISNIVKAAGYFGTSDSISLNNIISSHVFSADHFSITNAINGEGVLAELGAINAGHFSISGQLNGKFITNKVTAPGHFLLSHAIKCSAYLTFQEIVQSVGHFVTLDQINGVGKVSHRFNAGPLSISETIKCTHELTIPCGHFNISESLQCSGHIAFQEIVQSVGHFAISEQIEGIGKALYCANVGHLSVSELLNCAQYAIIQAVSCGHFNVSDILQGDRVLFFWEDILALVNAERVAESLLPLTLNDKLQDAAIRHAQDMADNTFNSHTGSDSSTTQQRIDDTGYSYLSIGENIISGTNTVNAETFVQSWMGNAPNEANILNSNFKNTGVFDAVGSDSNRYICQVFGDPEPITIVKNVGHFVVYDTLLAGSEEIIVNLLSCNITLRKPWVSAGIPFYADITLSKPIVDSKAISGIACNITAHKPLVNRPGPTNIQAHHPIVEAAAEPLGGWPALISADIISHKPIVASDCEVEGIISADILAHLPVVSSKVSFANKIDVDIEVVKPDVLANSTPVSTNTYADLYARHPIVRSQCSRSTGLYIIKYVNPRSLGESELSPDDPDYILGF